MRDELLEGKDWELLGKHLEYLTLHKQNEQCRLVKMWQNANVKGDVVIEEIEISKEMYEKFKDLIGTEQS